MATERLGKAVLELTTDTSTFYPELDKAEKRIGGLGNIFDASGEGLKSFGKQASSLGGTLTTYVTAPIAGVGAALAGLVVSSAKAGDQIAKDARTAGLSAGSYQQLKFAIGQIADVTEEELVKGFAKMTNVIGEGAKGTKSAVDALQQLGFTQAEIAAGTITTEEAFNRFNAAMQNAKSPAEALTLAGDLVGDRLGPKLAGALREGGAEVDGLRERAVALGIVMSGDALDGSEKFNDQLDELMAAFAGIGRELGTAFLPLITETLVPFIMTSVIPAVKSFVEFLRGLIGAFTDLPGPIQAAIGIVAGLAAAIGPLLVAIGGVASAIGAALPVITTIGGALAGLASGPVLLIGGAIAGLVAIWVKWGDDITRITREALSAVVGFFNNYLMPILGPIGELLASIGNLFLAFGKLAGGVFVKLIGETIAFVKDLTLWLVEKTRPIWEFFKPAFDIILLGFKVLKDGAVTAAKLLFEGVSYYLIDKFKSIVSGIKGAIDSVTGFFNDMYMKVVGGSIVPDMLAGIGREFAKLDGVMVRPTREHTTATTGLFEGMGQSIGRTFSGIVSAAGDAFGQMLTGAASFKEGFLGIWDSIKSTALQIFDSIRQGFVNSVINGILAALTGARGGFSQAFSSFVSGGSGFGGFGGGGGIPGLGGLFGGGGSAAAPFGPGVVSNAGVNGLGGGFGAFATSGLGASLIGGGVGLGVGAFLSNKFGKGAGIAGGIGSGALTGFMLGGPIGAGIGALAGLVGGLLGKGQGEKANDLRDQLVTEVQKTYGSGSYSGYTGGMGKIGELLDKGGRADLFQQLIAADTPDKVARVGTEIAKVLDATAAKIAAGQQAVQDLGLSWEDLTAEIRGQKLDELGQAVVDKTTAAVDAGYEFDRVIAKQAEAYSYLAIKAIEFGEKLPASMKPAIDRLIELGLLVDKNGNKITEFGQDMYDAVATKGGAAIEDLKKRFGDLVLSAEGDVAKIEGAFGKLRLPTLSSGGLFDSLRGAETLPFDLPSFDNRPLERVVGDGLAMLHQGDVVGVPPAQGPSRTVNLTVHAIDASSFREFLRSGAGMELVRYFQDNDGRGMPVGPTTILAQALGVSG